jgi:hypothetical protein
MKKNENIKIIICSDLDHENLVAEITIDNKFIGLISEEPNQDLCFELPNGQAQFEIINLDAFESAIAEARKALKLMGPIDSD